MTESGATILQRGRKLVWLLQLGVIFLASWTAWLQFGCTDAERSRHEANTLRKGIDLARRGTVQTCDGFVLAQDLLAWRVGVDPAAIVDAVARDSRVPNDQRTAEAIRRARIVLRGFPVDLLQRGRSLDEVERLVVYAIEPPVDRPRRRYVAIGELHAAADLQRYSKWESTQRATVGARAFSIDRFYRRDYPHPILASQVLGEVGRDGYGLWGIEAVWNSALTGHDGIELAQRVGAARMTTPAADGVPRIDGRDLVLTIDSRAQQLLEAEVCRAHEEWQAELVLGLVVDPTNGAVRALASTPLLDRRELDDLSGAARMSKIKQCAQRLSSYQFEPGSVMKSFILSEVYRRGIDPHQLVTDGHKSWRYRGRTVTDSSHHEPLDIEQAVVHSSNIGLARVGLLLGGDSVRECVTRFGFGQPTRIGLDVHEWPGSVTSARSWSYYATTGVPFGYEIGVTTLQLARAYCALVNGGDLVQLHVVSGLVGDPLVGPAPAPVGAGPARPVLGDELAGERISARVRKTLRDVVLHGTGDDLEKPLFGQPIGLAGKTGTARVSAGKAGYIEGSYRSSFVGFAPFDEPRWLALVVVVKPQGAHYGAVVAGPPVRRVLGALMNSPSPELDQRLAEVVRLPDLEAMYDASHER